MSNNFKKIKATFKTIKNKKLNKDYQIQCNLVLELKMKKGQTSHMKYFRNVKANSF